MAEKTSSKRGNATKQRADTRLNDDEGKQAYENWLVYRDSQKVSKQDAIRKNRNRKIQRTIERKVAQVELPPRSEARQEELEKKGEDARKRQDEMEEDFSDRQARFEGYHNNSEEDEETLDRSTGFFIQDDHDKIHMDLEDSWEDREDVKEIDRIQWELEKQRILTNLEIKRKQEIQSILKQGRTPQISMYTPCDEAKCSLHNRADGYTACKKCRDYVKEVEGGMFYHHKLFKKRSHYLRKLWECGGTQTDEWKAWFGKMYLKNPKPARPIVPKQPVYGDINDADFDQVMTRAEKRLQEWQAQFKQGGADSFVDVIRDIIRWCLENHIAHIVITLVLGIIIATGVHYLLRTQPESAILQVLKAVTVIFGIVLASIAFSVAFLDILSNLISALSEFVSKTSEFEKKLVEEREVTVGDVYDLIEIPGGYRRVRRDDGSESSANITPKIILQDGDDPSEVVANHLKAFGDGLLEAVGHVKDTGKGVLNVTHQLGNTLRDCKVIVEVFQPVCEWLIGYFYEKAFGEVWIPPSQRTLHNRILPMMKVVESWEEHASMRVYLSLNYEARGEVDKTWKDLCELEAELIKMKTPPRYMRPVMDLKIKVSEAQTILKEIKLSGKEKAMPELIYICGKSKAGKGELTRKLMRDIWANRALFQQFPEKSEFDESKVYVRNPNEPEFWSGYRDQFFTVWNDWGMDREVKTKTAQVKEIITVINPEKAPLAMGDLPSKGTTHYSSPVGIINTNLGPFISGTTNESNTAFYRRRSVVISTAAAPDRVPMTKDTPAEIVEKGWIITLHDAMGNPIGKVTYKQVLEIVISHLQAAAKWEQTEHSAPSLVTQEGLGAGARLAAVLDKANQKAIEKVELSEKKKMQQDKGKRKKQGANQVKDKRKSLTRIEMADFLRDLQSATYDLAEHYHKLFDFAYEYDLLKPDTHEKFLREDGEVDLDQYNVSAIMMLMNKIVDNYVEATADTVVHHYDNKRTFLHKLEDFWDALCAVPGRIKAFVMRNIWEGVFQRAKTKMVEWIQTHKTAVIFSAIGVLAAVAGFIGLGVYLTRATDEKVKQTEDKEMERTNKHLARAEKAHEKWDRAVDDQLRQHYAKQVETMEASTEVLIAHNQFSFLVMGLEEQADGSHLAAKGQVLMVRGRYALTALHIATRMDEVIAKSKLVSGHLRQAGADGKTVEIPFNPREVKWVRILGTESAIMLFGPVLPEFKKIVHHFPQNEWVCEMGDKYLDGVIIYYRTGKGAWCHQSSERANMVVIKFEDDDEHMLYWKCVADTPNGSSGGVWTTPNAKLGRKLLGIHTGRSTVDAYASVLTCEKIEATIATFSTNEKHYQSTDVVVREEVTSAVYKQGILNNTFVYGDVEHGVSLPRSNPTSQSIIARYLREQGSFSDKLPINPRPYVPSTLKSKWQGLGVVPLECDIPAVDERVSPLELTYNKRSVIVVDPPTALLDLARMEFRFPSATSGYYFIPTMEDAVFGNAAMGIQGMDMTSSPGWPYTVIQGCNTRRLIFDVKQPGERSDRSRWKERFLNDMKWASEHYRAGKHILPCVTDQIKVEELPIEKVFAGKVRIFYATSIDSLVWSSMFQHDLFKRIKAQQRTHNNIVGINPHSSEWGELYKWLCAFSNWMGEDGSSWDIKQMYKVLYALLGDARNSILKEEIITREPLLAGFSQQQLRDAFSSIFLGKIHAVHIQKVTLFEMLYTLCSGTFGTSQTNGLIGEKSYMTCVGAWVIEKKINLHGADLVTFYLANFRNAWFGDDYLGTCSDFCKDNGWGSVTHAYYSKLLFNIDLTTPDKKPIKEQFIKREEAAIIKRNFVQRDGYLYAPLPKSTIESSLHWCSDQSRATDIIISTARGAIRESVHHGRDYHRYLTQLIENAMRRANISFHAMDYDYLDNMLRNGTYTGSD